MRMLSGYFSSRAVSCFVSDSLTSGVVTDCGLSPVTSRITSPESSRPKISSSISFARVDCEPGSSQPSWLSRSSSCVPTVAKSASTAAMMTSGMTRRKR